MSAASLAIASFSASFAALRAATLFDRSLAAATLKVSRSFSRAIAFSAASLAAALVPGSNTIVSAMPLL